MDILFWSGGKDSYLAYIFYRKKFPHHPLTILTTYTKNTQIVPHQNIPLDHIKEQAESLGVASVLVGLPEKCPNEEYLKRVNHALTKMDEEIDHLIFGDWHLEDIRKWRESQFSHEKCLFSIWEKSLHELLPVLLLQPVEVRISAVAEEHKHVIAVGEIFNQLFVRQLPAEIDPMGEFGEFHTKVCFYPPPQSNKS